MTGSRGCCEPVLMIGWSCPLVCGLAVSEVWSQGLVSFVVFFYLSWCLLLFSREGWGWAPSRVFSVSVGGVRVVSGRPVVDGFCRG